MRRIIAFDNVSADGYFSDVGGTLDWTTPDPELNAHVLNSNGKIDTGLFGRITYEHFEAFWPNAAKDPTLPKDLRAFADSLGDMTKVVYSTTRKDASWKNTKFVHKFDAREVERMKEARGDDIIIFGSGTMVRALTEHALIDEYQLIVNPVILGRGKSLLHDANVGTELELLESKAFASGNVLLRYARK